MQQPFRCEIEHKLGVSCVNSGPVICRVSLDRGGYVPGETIGISATVENHSKVTIKSTKAALTEVSVQGKPIYNNFLIFKIILFKEKKLTDCSLEHFLNH